MLYTKLISGKSQLLPEQAASYMNSASRISITSTKSPKGAPGFPLPGHESRPENNASIKMYVISHLNLMHNVYRILSMSPELTWLPRRLEAAVQRLTNLCSVLNDMEPICVLNHVFVLREVRQAFTYFLKFKWWLNLIRKSLKRTTKYINKWPLNCIKYCI